MIGRKGAVAKDDPGILLSADHRIRSPWAPKRVFAESDTLFGID